MNHLFRIRIFPSVLYFILFSTLNACEDSSAKETTIKGQVQTYGTEEKINHPSVLMQLVKKDRAGCFGCGSYYVVKDSFWTDEEGRFELKHKLYGDERYYLRAKYETVKTSWGYYRPEITDLDRNRVKTIGGQVNQDYHLIAKGWVRFHFISDTPQTGDLYWYTVSGGVYEEFNNSIDIERVWDFGGNMVHDVAFGLFRDGVYHNYREEFFVQAFDTIDIEFRI